MDAPETRLEARSDAAQLAAAELAAAEQAAQEVAAEEASAAPAEPFADEVDAGDVITKRVLVGGGLADTGAIAGIEAQAPSEAALPIAATAGAVATATAAANRAAEDGAQALDATPWLPIFGERASDPAICPFLRVADGDRLLAPVESPDAANRCAALEDPVPQSMRQQELVCLTSGHVNCPRYLRGSAATAAVPPPTVRPRSILTPAVLGSIAMFVGAFVLSVGFVASRGGLEISPPPGASASAAAVVPTAIAAPASPAATVAPAGSPSTAPDPTATPTAPPTPTPTPTATATPAPTPTPTPKPTPKATPKPTSDRYAVLVACPDRSNCWIYTVRSGDNLFSIANWFGVPLSRVYDLNPWVKTTGLRAGQELRIPTPTR